MKPIYKYYKERLIEISGKNRSLYSRKISKKYSYDIGKIIADDKEVFDDFFTFIWKGKKLNFPLIKKDIKDRIFKNFKLE